MPPKTSASARMLDALQSFFLVIATIPRWRHLDEKIVQRNKLALRDSTRTIYSCANAENLRESIHLGDDLLRWIGKDGKKYDGRPEEIPLDFLESSALGQPAPLLARLRPSCKKLLTDQAVLKKYLTLDGGDDNEAAPSKRVTIKQEPSSRPPKRNIPEDDESNHSRPGPATKKSRADSSSTQPPTDARPPAPRSTAQTNSQKGDKQSTIFKPTPVKLPQTPQNSETAQQDRDEDESESDDEPPPATHSRYRPIRSPCRDDLPSTDPSRDLADLIQLHVNQTARITEVQGHCRVLMDYYTRERNFYRMQLDELKKTVDARESEVEGLRQQVQQIRRYLGFGQDSKQPPQHHSQHPPRPHSVPAVAPGHSAHSADFVVPQGLSMHPPQPTTPHIPNNTPPTSLQNMHANTNNFENSNNFGSSMEFQGQFANGSSYPPFPSSAPPQDRMFDVNNLNPLDPNFIPQNQNGPPLTLPQQEPGSM
ncbi:hypothetical protein CC1G_07036 [Coprinopsis cinerea okayama7|uniref:Uncharacterized protein n=1 Tax=Coprinopsis cinerea (strain Okayama-7 / 130 / ATCC MYA-4618 / FGSC 9003) TaxID=240176 RepID=A8NAY3_COPC7|nr:hypothetical protein CC1G_07036 [Coprinopsis cinerea okayama7\|eukprot:XP_001831985.2 hypothetical protein CC1G_07036 [Coprinopsis cinerea okayama7\